jgi:A/G-specific adenine glycosylase
VREIEGCSHILLRRRPESGLLGGMMEVPCTEWSLDLAQEKSAKAASSNWTQAQAVQHTFTHFHLEMRVFAALCTQVEIEARAFDGEWAALSGLSQHALPSVMKKAVASGLEALGIATPQ